MRLSKSLRKTKFVRSKNVRRVIKAILFVLLFTFFTMILDMSFEFDERATETMLTNFSRKPQIDTVFVGNSVGEMMDADLYSSITGEYAFNMCTPSQSLSISFQNIKLASSHHKIRKVVLFASLDVVNSDRFDQIEHVYYRVVDSSSPVSTRISKAFRRNLQKSFSRETINKEQSVNIWIPWENETIHDMESFKNNLSYRFARLINRERLGSGIAYDLNVPKFAVADGTLTDADNALLQEDIATMHELPVPEGMLTEANLTLLAEILTFCQDNGIECSMIITPHRTDYFDRYASYREYHKIVSAYLAQFLSKREFAYSDTEDDADLHTILPDSYFYDVEHIRGEYKEQATEYLTRVIRELDCIGN